MALGDMMGMMKQAKLLQEKMQQMQEEVAALEIEGTAGGGLVKLTVDGKGAIKKLAIDPTLLKPEEVEILEDLIVAAHNDGRTRAEEKMAEKMRELTGGLSLPPGMQLPF
jgi:nucleoid-associated protein EbfC